MAIDDPRYKAELRKRAITLYREHGSLRKVGAILGVSHERVRQLIRTGGGKTRPPGRPPNQRRKK